MFSDSLTKAGRLLELHRMFWHSRGRGITTAELASKLGVAPRTVRKYLVELSTSGRLPVYRQGRHWRLAAHASFLIPPVVFHLEEATAVYLAARLLVQHAHQPNPAVQGAIKKLADVVPSDLRPALNRLAQRGSQVGSAPFATVFRALAYGWALSRTVRLEYKPRGSELPLACEFQPYLLEPSRLGSALYAIGHANPPGALRVFKVERIISATLTETTFAPVDANELLDRIARAWGVWLTDEEPVSVRMRFTPEVAPRVAETRWHPSQQLQPLPNGGVEMSVTVASPVELVHWILGWGAHCEVLAPESLRQQIAAELRRASEHYRSASDPPKEPPEVAKSGP